MRRQRGTGVTFVLAAVFQRVHAGQERAQLHRQLTVEDLKPFMQRKQPIRRRLSADQFLL
ncbi:MAG: hypothetical protein JO345_17400 [Streptosporangiaceae bacterium]|nr:hypothetical protein [Streptosporangiaceae bacterium]